MFREEVLHVLCDEVERPLRGSVWEVLIIVHDVDVLFGNPEKFCSLVKLLLSYLAQTVSIPCTEARTGQRERDRREVEQKDFAADSP